MLEQLAPWAVVVSAALALAVSSATGWRTWRHWTRVSRTRQAAVALVDVHSDRLDAAIELANERVGTIADDGEQLAEALAELRADVDHLRWMAGRLPEARDDLQRELLDLVLPTQRGERGDDR